MKKYAYNNLTDFEYMHWYICLEIDIILTKSKIWSYLSYIKFNSFWCNQRPNTVLNNIYDKHENTLNNKFSSKLNKELYSLCILVVFNIYRSRVKTWNNDNHFDTVLDFSIFIKIIISWSIYMYVIWTTLLLLCRILTLLLYILKNSYNKQGI